MESESGFPRYFSFTEAPPATPNQSSVKLTDADSLSAVFPVGAGSFSSGVFAHVLGGVELDNGQVTVDSYRFPTGFSGDALVAPWEQSAYIGTLPAGNYELVLRQWALTAEDRLGFDPSSVPLLPHPDLPKEGEITALPLHNRFVTEQRFEFTVLATNVPEPSSVWAAFGAIASLVAACRLRRF